MTKAEAVKGLYEIRHYLTQGNPIWSTDVVDEVLSMAINALEVGEEMSLANWIPCTERLPEAQFEGQRRGYYLTTNANGIVGETRYEFYHDFMKTGWQSDFRIVAWMPLPAPYKVVE